jgi:hypothetical protein
MAQTVFSVLGLFILVGNEFLTVFSNLFSCIEVSLKSDSFSLKSEEVSLKSQSFSLKSLNFSLK